MVLPITGYADRFSVAPGDPIEFKLSSTAAEAYTARLVRIIHADPNPAGPGVKHVDLREVYEAKHPSREQPVQLGSYAIVEGLEALPALESFSVVATIWPTATERGLQAIVSCSSGLPEVAPVGDAPPRETSGFALCLNEHGAVEARLAAAGGDVASVSTGKRLRERAWYRIWMSYEPSSRRLAVGHSPVTAMHAVDDSGEALTTLDGAALLPAGAPLLLAALSTPASVQDPRGGRATHRTCCHFNGKLERPMLIARALEAPEAEAAAAGHIPDDVLALWDFSHGISTMRVVDVGPLAWHGRLENLPARAMTGSNWTGEDTCWRHRPEHYGAIHFHDDDLYDCGWDTDFTFVVPEDLASGCYAMHVQSGAGYDTIPFFVRPPRGRRTADVCVLVPTFTYTVYGNHARNNTDETYRKRAEAWGARPWTADEHPEYGFSTYNFHSDGSGIAYASRLRPMITMRPEFLTVAETFNGSGLRHYPADTHLFDWLEEKGFEYDVVTDEDLHAEGAALVDGYQALLTTSHPEYHTPESRQAIHDYSRNGGHLLYLGGNGFYWRVAVHPELPGAVEIRRGESGIRAWAAEPGEYFNALDGQYGGMWRRNARPPQALAGVGFSAQGLFQGAPYRRTPASYEPAAAWMFEGIEDEVIGDFGLSGGGAAGYELDRADTRLGTPPNAVILASSEGHQDHYVLVPEELLTHVSTWTGEPAQSLIRADIVFFETPADGWVFSVGSITFCGSLSHDGYDNNISRLIENVLRRATGAS